jgi:hypothetical protein
MPQPIKITMNGVVVHGELLDTPCARAIAAILPLEARPQEWGDEFYFEIKLRYPCDETATMKVNPGDIGYWSPGNALAVFFGPTPSSTGPDPVPASAVNIVGRIVGDPSILREAKGSSRIRIVKE